MPIYFLTPDWRHAHCCELTKRRYTTPAIKIGQLVRSYLTYLRWLHDETNRSESVPLPAIAFRDELRLVHTIQHESRCRQLRDELQSRVLAAQPRRLIASATGLSMVEVAIYEYLYFSVRRRLNQLEYIHSMVIDDTSISDPEELFSLAIKKLAYGGGVAVLDTVLLLGRTLQAKNQGSTAEYLVRLREVLGRIDRSELPSFLKTTSRQGLYTDVMCLLESLLGIRSTDIMQSLAERQASVPEIHDDVKRLIETAQLAAIRAA